MKMREYFTAYRNVVPSEYENWLEELAADGWHPKRINHFTSMIMTFQKSQPKKYKYAIELLGHLKKDRINMYKDFGWEYAGRMSSIFVWRKEYEDQKPEMFTDHKDIVKRNYRFIIAISFSFVIFLITFITTCVLAVLAAIGKIAPEREQIILGLVLSGVLTFYLGHVIRKINKNKDK